MVGSILFLWASLETIGVWFFIVGSTGMFIGSLGAAIVKLVRTEEDVDGAARVAATSSS